MLNLKDVVDLAKAGYTVKDVKELIELSKAPETEQSTPQPVSTETEQSKSESPTQDEVAEMPAKESDQPAAETDYKALYEAEKAKVDSLQKINNSKDVSGNKNDEVDLLALVKAFM